MKKTALLLGASGLVGGELLKLLLSASEYDTVFAAGRTKLELNHLKLNQKIGDLTEPTIFNELPSVDELFICIGTTRSKTPDLNTYKKIDYGIPVLATKWAVQHGTKKVFVISALGANANSRIFYNHVKGTMEKELIRLKPQTLFILRPSLILGKREEFRFGEWLGKVASSVFGFLIPKKYKGIEAKTIATAMFKLATEKSSTSEQIIESDKIKELAM